MSTEHFLTELMGFQTLSIVWILNNPKIKRGDLYHWTTHVRNTKLYKKLRPGSVNET
jgi:hypothetical protein